ncbi:hypothetical protein C808_01980, partial [Lachnospiraceae bacterium M18-1]
FRTVAEWEGMPMAARQGAKVRNLSLCTEFAKKKKK